MLPQDTDGFWPGGQERQGQQTFSSVSSFISSILSLGQLRKQSDIVSYNWKKNFMQIIKLQSVMSVAY